MTEKQVEAWKKAFSISTTREQVDALYQLYKLLGHVNEQVLRAYDLASHRAESGRRLNQAI
jgi:hypothetical protein